jgi:hypothetical protein
MRHILFAATLALCGCASSPPPAAQTPTAAAQPGHRPQVCSEERTTGSNIAHVVCRDPDDTNAEREVIQRWGVHPRSQTTMGR